MKRVLLVVVVLLMTSMLVFAGGGKDKGAAAGGGEPAFIVDISKLKPLRNEKPLTAAWSDHMILLPQDVLPSDLSKYTRVTIAAKFFNAAGEPVEAADSMAMVTVIYDPSGDIRGPSMGPGANTPVKEFNVGGFSGTIHKDRGIRMTFSQAPGAILFQNNPGGAVFIELASFVFHNGNYKSE